MENNERLGIHIEGIVPRQRPAGAMAFWRRGTEAGKEGQQTGMQYEKTRQWVRDFRTCHSVGASGQSGPWPWPVMK